MPNVNVNVNVVVVVASLEYVGMKRICRKRMGSSNVGAAMTRTPHSPTLLLSLLYSLVESLPSYCDMSNIA